MRRLILSFLALGILASSARAELPPEERTAETRRWLAVAMVAEAGWAPPDRPKAAADHRAIFHVLKNRWPRLRKRWPKLYPHFADVVQGYVAAFDPRTEKGGRVRWLLRLRPGIVEAPVGWPGRANWKRHRVWWEAVVQRAGDCMEGRRCRDPYRGQALHWGATFDAPRGCMVPLPNAGTLNVFYTVSMECKKKRRDDMKRRGRPRGRRSDQWGERNPNYRHGRKCRRRS